ncbi:MAG: helix-turn-helix domain-containing protein [Ruminococcus flavefaciens]|nr:helix-turn-helix domain-containing protein [Ruminococcus flavefaciens]
MFFEQLTKACKMRNITVTNLTTYLQISKSNVTNWKKGTIPNGEVIVRISEYLGVSTDFLLKGDTENVPESIIDTNSQNPTITESQNVEINGIKNESMLNVAIYANRLSFEHIEINNDKTISENIKELIKVFESLPTKEQIRLMNIVYDFEEKFKNQNK